MDADTVGCDGCDGADEVLQQNAVRVVDDLPVEYNKYKIQQGRDVLVSFFSMI